MCVGHLRARCVDHTASYVVWADVINPQRGNLERKGIIPYVTSDPNTCHGATFLKMIMQVKSHVALLYVRKQDMINMNSMRGVWWLSC